MRQATLSPTLRTTALTLGTALALWTAAPAALAANTATAEASISNVKVTLVALDAEPWVTGAWPWIVQNTASGWPATAESTGVTADLLDAAQHNESIGWIGTSRSAAAGSANASASASVSFSGTAPNRDLFNPGAASSFASASGGEIASATARLWDAAFMVGGRTRVVVTMTLDGLTVVGNGGTATALASLSMWGPLSAGYVSAEAQAIDSPDFSLAYDGPNTLSVSWDNASTNMVVADISLLTSAQVLSVAAPVPEPESMALCLAGLLVVAGVLRRRAPAVHAAQPR
jgi:hypothetical protein